MDDPWVTGAMQQVDQTHIHALTMANQCAMQSIALVIRCLLVLELTHRSSVTTMLVLYCQFRQQPLALTSNE